MSKSLPFILAGPMVRKTMAHEINLWLSTTKPLHGRTKISTNSGEYEFEITQEQGIQLGQCAWVYLLRCQADFPVNQRIQYDIDTQDGLLSQLVPDALYEDESSFTLFIKDKADYVLHGSCRNPHYASKDSLVIANQQLKTQALEERAALLMMSGDQIYADDVAGPMLHAIQQIIPQLGLFEETLIHSEITNDTELYAHPHNLYYRDKILPHYVERNNFLSRCSLYQTRPIFSSTKHENHLMSIAEFFVMYLLVWSPTLWKRITLPNSLPNLEPKWQKMWQEEKQQIDLFVAGLNDAQQLFAHMPTYMIFDDHDITDDWNLTIGWENAVNGDLLASQVIGNGLISYFLCQGWGNNPEQFDEEFLTSFRALFANYDNAQHHKLIWQLTRFEQWHYSIHTSPKMVVLDTRTRRWRSESNTNKPSGLMDWEALLDLQHELIDQESIIIVSATPIFGVKFIEALQKTMTILGQPLMVDAENWMTHPGSANTLLSILTHPKTPQNFVILSGDVHYSFAYDIKLRHSKSSPDIYQITCSGFKNEFPNKLLRVCDFMDRVLYSPHSPLNWFTKRKNLLVTKRDPSVANNDKLINKSSIGELRLDEKGKPEQISILTAEGESISFLPKSSD
ncbi:alkaline phosphatase family protein [Aliivibrio sp. S3MY1]|uniref:alkaline phosphatase family protein n=1 Tax=unclassified Aliivibrio TaxID=2645654 RepID=UPI0023794837|nr:MULTISPECIES: alkaline phosphatase family protein [unclassified Aliivibrio]MDD9194993.1 alkaline phosphatase family protein [Aliivibrio sp. S3MY1]MDD9198289.1 alkaline phosphatase family protein [Aliivibrio sp. S2MY1]